VFTTKSFGIGDMERQLGVHDASLMPHGFDPETHRPMRLAPDDKERYACDVSFIGTWSPKKEAMLALLRERLPEVRLRIWGSQWEKARADLGDTVQRREVLGAEYAKAIAASRINLAILSERRPGASSGDLITSRTFHIPASGGFMLHERTHEVQRYFREGVECAMFVDASEMTEKVRYYLAHEEERRRVAEAGFQRSIGSNYSIDHRAAEVIVKARKLLSMKAKGIAREK
jgi:spore maturation protein CgeB